MAIITSILFPVDFSPSCVAMGTYVKRAASILGAQVSLLHVFDPNSYSGVEVYLRGPVEIAEEHQEVARQKLNHFLHHKFPAAHFPRILACGDPAAEIAKTARRGFDIIIMPTHAGSFRRTLLGSTTAKVLDAADCPVETSHHAETIAPRPMEHRELLCAIALSEDSERVLGYAHQEAQQAHSNLRIIHAIPADDPKLPVRLDLGEHIQSAERREASQRIEALQKKVGSNAPVRIAVGPVKEALLEAARHSDADALIIGRSPQPGYKGRLRDLTYSVIRDSPFPVISV